MEKNQLSFFEKLINQILAKKGHTKISISLTTVEKIRAEGPRILHSIATSLCYIDDSKEITQQVNIVMQQVIFLMDRVTNRLTINDLTEISRPPGFLKETNIIQIIYNALSQLLLNIEKSYSTYFDIHVKVPFTYLLAVKGRYGDRLYAIAERYTGYGVDPMLIDIISESFTDFHPKDISSTVTYHRLFYLKRLVDRLSLIRSRSFQNPDPNRTLYDILLEFNFNHPEYYKYVTAEAKKEMEGLPLREQIEWLIKWQKHINQIAIQPGLIYQPLDISLKQHLHNWIAAEMNCLKELSLLSIDNPDTEETNRWKNFKISTQLSVPQLGNFLKLTMDAGFILNENKTEFLEFCACYFSTVQQKNIAAGSLRKNFYAEDAAVSESVRGILQQLIARSKE
ncbi:hypothetical protein F0L74_29520 [Chitinophaga agrisoli]|uniref:Uncharacterized protein n=1 Tax=Chitinophaga agrisoli TaxID=2607653 RepID=A0A5B2VNF0_9BACT|nr:hypothetical protein [Chitinophaga agrisoli]KAA2240304.1 hypothetical protein F0L74_29520 [Chitinophaga agrisoli]